MPAKNHRFFSYVESNMIEFFLGFPTKLCALYKNLDMGAAKLQYFHAFYKCLSGLQVSLTSIVDVPQAMEVSVFNIF